MVVARSIRPGYGSIVILATSLVLSPGAVIIFVAFAIVAFVRAVRFKQRTGRNPWGIHPVLWLLAGLLFGLIGSILCFVAVATTKTGPVGGQYPYPYNAPQPGYGGGYGAPPPGQYPPQAAPAGWMPDPTGRHQYRYWSGAGWTSDVSTNGVQSTDPFNEPAAPPTVPGPAAPGGGVPPYPGSPTS